MRYPVTHLRSKLGIVIVGAATLAAAATSVALAAPSHVRPPSCYGSCPSAISLSLSLNTVVFGSEQHEIFRVAVHSAVPGVRGMPTGILAVKYQKTILCRIRLANKNVGQCSPSAKALPAMQRIYLVRAYYSGNTIFSPSASSNRALKVIKQPRRRNHRY